MRAQLQPCEVPEALGLGDDRLKSTTACTSQRKALPRNIEHRQHLEGHVDVNLAALHRSAAAAASVSRRRCSVSSHISLLKTLAYVDPSPGNV